MHVIEELLQLVLQLFMREAASYNVPCSSASLCKEPCQGAPSYHPQRGSHEGQEAVGTLVHL